MSSSHLPSFLAATAERLQPGATVVAEGAAWRPPFEGVGFTNCAKPALRGGVAGKVGEARPFREAPSSRGMTSFSGSYGAAGSQPPRDELQMIAREAAESLDAQWKTREMSAVAPPTPQPPAAVEPPPEPTSGERLARLLAPSASTAVTPAPNPAPPERFAPIPVRSASVGDALTRLSSGERATGSAALLRDMIATLANRDSATMRALAPPPKPANTTLSPGRFGAASQTRLPAPNPEAGRGEVSSRAMPTLSGSTLPKPLPTKKQG